MTPADFDFSQYTSPGGEGHSSSGPAAHNEYGIASGFLGTADSEVEPSGGFEVAGPPFVWLAVGIGVVVAGIALAIVFSSVVAVAFIAWALSGPLAIGAFAVFSLRDTKQRAKPLYGQRASAIWLHRVGLVLALVGVVLSAIAIAGWAGRL